MKILYVSSSKIPSRTANSIHVMKMCHAWAAAGHDVVLLAQHEKELYEPGVNNIFDFYGVKNIFKVVRLPSFSTNLIFAHLFGVLCAGYALAFRPDIIYGREASGVYWSSLLGYPAIFEIHNPDTLKGFYPRKLLRSDRLQYLVVISQKLKQLATAMSNQKQIVVAHDGADADVPAPSGASEDAMFDFSMYSTSYNVGYTGHLYPGKGAEVIGEFAKQLPDIFFHIFGGDEKDIARLKVNAPSNLIFHGFIPQSLVPFAQQSMDILLLPAQRKVVASGYKGAGVETNISDFMSPLKLFEYMRSGKPIIASDIPVLGEVLENEVNALLRTPDDIRQWTQAILRLRKSEKLAVTIAQNARNDFLEKYSWKARSEIVLAKLDSCI